MKQKRGFTLIELLVVVLIIGILSAIALPQYQKTVYKARMAEVPIRVKAMEQAINLYTLENGFPASGKIDLFEVYPDLAEGLIPVECGSDQCYKSKWVGYRAKCSSTSCSLEAYFSKSGNPVWAAMPDTTKIIRSFSKSSGWGTGYCWWFAGGDKYGPAICSVMTDYVGESD